MTKHLLGEGDMAASTMREYKNFDLQVQLIDGKYQASVLDSPAGQAKLIFDQVFAKDELQYFLTQRGQSRQFRPPSEQGAESNQSALGDPQQWGGRLFNAIFRDELLGCWRTSLSLAKQQGQGLRLRLRLTAAPELNTWPWEFLYDTTQATYIALSANTPLVRYLDIPIGAEALVCEPPLRALTLIANPAGVQPLAGEREWQLMQDGLRSLQEKGLVKVERLQSPTLLALQRQLRRQQYHILHFIGHGAFDPKGTGGFLLLEDDSGQSQLESAFDLATVLKDHGTLRLVVLNACEGSRTSGEDPFTGIAQTLIRQAIPAVIAMQFPITDAAAVVFAEEFYTALADYYPVDAALAEARKAMTRASQQPEWATPVLFLRAPDGYLFRHPNAASTAVAPSADQAPDNSGVKVQINNSNLTASPINISFSPHSASTDAAKIASQSFTDLGQATTSDQRWLQLTQQEGEIRRVYRNLLKLDDQLLFSDDPALKKMLQMQIDQQIEHLRTLLPSYLAQARQAIWSVPPDIQAASERVGSNK